MPSAISVKRISAGATFKVLFIGFMVFHVSTTLLVGLLVVIGILPVEPAGADNSVAALLAVLAYLVVGILFSPIWVGALWLSIWPGVWLYSLFRPMSLTYVPPDDPSES